MKIFNLYISDKKQIFNTCININEEFNQNLTQNSDDPQWDAVSYRLKDRKVEYFSKIGAGYKVSDSQIAILLDDSIQPQFNDEYKSFNTNDPLIRRALIFLKKGNTLTEKNYSGSTIESFEQDILPALKESGFIGLPIYHGFSPLAESCSCKTFFGEPECTGVVCEISSLKFCVPNPECEVFSGTGSCACLQDL